MALSLPRAVKTLITQSPDATRLADGLAQSIQPVLNFLNGTMSQAADGTLQILRGIAVAGASKLGATVVDGPLVVNGDETINSGTLTVRGDPTNSAKNSVVIGSPASASAAQMSAHVLVYGGVDLRMPNGRSLCIVPGGAGAAFYTTNLDNSAAMMTIDEIGNIWSRNAVTATNFVSGAGFRASIYMGGYWTTTYAANYMGACMHPVRNQSNGTLGETPSQRVMSWSGSVLAIIVNQAGSIGGTTSVQVYKNYQPWIPLTPVGSGTSPYTPLSFTKGRYTFARSDVLTVYLTTTASGNTQLTCHLDVEYGA